jgi:DNA-binding XRE family transcriptional regulator
MEDKTMSFGEKLVEYRKSRGMKQNKFAGLIGIHPETLGAIERGRYYAPRVETIGRIIEALHLSNEEAVDLIMEAYHNKHE